MTRLIGTLLVCCALALGGVWVAAQVDLTTFQPDTPILSAEVNANFAALEDALATLADRESVATLNALTGAVELVAGANIDLQIDPDSGTITIAGGAAGGGDGVPSGAVMAFNLAGCPDGWTIFASAQGRTLVGTDPAGTLAGTVGDPLTDLEALEHDHTVDSQDLSTGNAGAHSHIWSNFSVSGGVETWRSGDGEVIINWNNGIDDEGVGTFPLATDGATSNDDFHTEEAGIHSHDIIIPEIDTTAAAGHLPYVQLLYCQRD